jgi:hypothetical protein
MFVRPWYNSTHETGLGDSTFGGLGNFFFENSGNLQKYVFKYKKIVKTGAKICC